MKKIVFLLIIFTGAANMYSSEEYYPEAIDTQYEELIGSPNVHHPVDQLTIKDPYRFGYQNPLKRKSSWTKESSRSESDDENDESLDEPTEKTHAKTASEIIMKYQQGIPSNALQEDLLQDVMNLKKLQRGSKKLKITLEKFLGNLKRLGQIKTTAAFQTKKKTLKAQIISDVSAINSKLQELFE
ncbi:MAG: hypothetical protein K2X90_04105 [Candidatus Babeliaceae bacterium]|nr:hypothetical protein [Candidatus Babeliaceae bacterium]